LSGQWHRLSESRRSTTKFEIRPFTANLLDALIALINEAIAGRRNAAPVVADEFRRRVLAHPGFDASGLLLAVDKQGKLLGAVHAILPPIDILRYRRLAGQGFILGPYVRGVARRQGIGRALLAEAEKILASACEVVWIHGLRSPFYHTQEGPRQPYCGSTEVIGLTHDDLGLLDFLDRAGYQPDEVREVSMAALLHSGEVPKQAPDGLELVRPTPQSPWPGPVAWALGVEKGYGYERFGIDTPYDTLAVAQGDTIVGHCQWYPMRRAGRVVLFDLQLDPSLRGRGIGNLLLKGALALMAEAGYREVELHTSPHRNTTAYGMYTRYGFREVAEWLMLKKALH